ncbi:MAG: HAD family hydrolase, partial [Arcobacter butzleri]|nr:HAD family hydrolase [Aliarcobacter butzleri]
SSEFFYNSPVYTKKQRDLFEEYYYEICTQNLKLYDGIYELLNNLKNDFYLSVATNAYTTFAKKMLSHLNIDDFFINITGADLVENSKPHPDMIEKIIKELNHNKQTLLIGDSLKDAYAAQNANIDSILVNWGFSKHKEDYVEDTKELLKEIYARFNI